MRRNRLFDDEQDVEINLSPMIDCIFILLIFFIVTTVFVEENGLQVNKPDAAAAAPSEETESVAIEITAENEIMLDGEEASLAVITAAVKAATSEEEVPVVIRAHAKSSHQTFVSVWDAAKRGGSAQLSFSTVN